MCYPIGFKFVKFFFKLSLGDLIVHRVSNRKETEKGTAIDDVIKKFGYLPDEQGEPAKKKFNNVFKSWPLP